MLADAGLLDDEGFLTLWLSGNAVNSGLSRAADGVL